MGRMARRTALLGRRRQHSGGRSSPLMHQPERQRRIDDLTQQMGRILHELADLEPPDLVTVPLALPLDVAAYVSELAAQRGVDVPPIYISLLLHGALHGALEHGLRADAQRILGIIRRLASREGWEGFVAQRSGVRDGGARLEREWLD